MPEQAVRGGVCVASTHWKSDAKRRWVFSSTLRLLYVRERPATLCAPRSEWLCRCHCP